MPDHHTKWQDGLFLCVIFTFTAATALNFMHTFSPSGNPPLLGTLLSYGYLAVWIAAVCLLRDRKSWIWTTFILRTATVLAVFITMVLTSLDLDTKSLICGAIAYLPFGVLYPVYGGLPRAVLNSRLFFAIPIAQAIVSMGLFFRMRWGRTPS